MSHDAGSPKGVKRLVGWQLAVVVTLLELGILGLSVGLALVSPNVGTALGGAATLVLAGLTIVILVYNAGVLDATRNAAIATQREAEATLEAARATRDQADASRQQVDVASETLQEQRRTREFDWQPFIVFTQQGTQMVDGRLNKTIVLRNIGRGPALNCIYADQERQKVGGTLFLRSPVAHLAGGGDSATVIAEQRLQPASAGLFSDQLDESQLVFCKDQFGNLFRFDPRAPQPSMWLYSTGLGNQSEPPWLGPYQELVDSRAPDPEPAPGPAFEQWVSTSGNPSRCMSTVVLEGVPASDLEPPRDAIDAIRAWVFRVHPDASTPALDATHWIVRAPDKRTDDWFAFLQRGPCLAVSRQLPLGHVNPDNWDVDARELPLADLVGWWKHMVAEMQRQLGQLGTDHVRLGLTLITYGASGAPHLGDIDFQGLPKPPRAMGVGREGLRHISVRSEPFKLGDWPATTLEAGVRAALRALGYDDVDELIAALDLNATDEATAW